MTIRDKCLAILPLILVPSLSAQPTQQEKGDLHKVEIENTQSFSMISKEVPSQKYIIKVYLPESYNKSASRRYPVLYLLDGDHAFAMATDIIQYLQYGHFLPEIIMVATAYGSRDTDSGHGNMRMRDLLYYEWPGLSYPSGQAKNFLAFFKNELIPHVESRFRINSSDRTIWGYSGGGAFSTFVLCNEPQLFQKYIIVSRTGRKAVELLKQSKPNLSGLALKLYFCHGEYENSRATEFIALLKKDNLALNQRARLAAVDS